MRLVLLLSCPDRPGIVAAVSRWILETGGNVVEADQHTEPEAGLFLQRIEFDSPVEPDAARSSFAPVADQLGMAWQVHAVGRTPRVLVLASRAAHCVYDLLSRIATGDLDADPIGLVSNHDELAEAADRFGVGFHHLPVVDGPEAQEQALIDLVAASDPDLVVLARYMRILPGRYVARFGERTINIHHSFLPAFAGARPYLQAHRRGVKLIGATAHYVTEALDAGPIIAQGITAVSHRDTVDDLKRHGRDIETTVLARAVRLHLEHRVIRAGDRTVVFD